MNTTLPTESDTPPDTTANILLPAAGRRWAWLALLIPLGLLGSLYQQAGRELVGVWENDPNYSHGYIVVLASFAFALPAWRRSKGGLGQGVAREAVVSGGLKIVFGLFLHGIAWFAHVLLLDVLSFIFVVRGLLLVFGGRGLHDALGFAVLFLIFSAPLPTSWYQPLALFMQQLVSSLSAFTLDLAGAAVWREGYYLHMAGYTMEVGEACSGLRQLTAMLALAVAMGKISGRGMLFRTVLAACALPIAIAANCIRVVLSGVILMTLGKRWAEGIYHTLEGLVIVGLAALLVMGVAWALGQAEDWLHANKTQKPEPEGPVPVVDASG